MNLNSNICCSRQFKKDDSFHLALQEKIISYSLNKRIYVPEETLSFRYLKSARWNEVNCLSIPNELIKKVLIVVADLFPKTFAFITPSRKNARKFANTLTSCVENAYMVVDLFSNSRNVHLLKVMPISCHYTIPLRYNQHISIDLKVRNFFGNSISKIEDLTSELTDKEYFRFKAYIKRRLRVEKPDIKSEDDFSKYVVSHLKKYDFNKDQFNLLVNEIEQKKGSRKGWIFFMLIQASLELAVYHTFIIEQIPRVSLLEKRGFRIHQSWASKYTLYDNLFSRYGINLEKCTTEDDLYQFLKDLKVLVCYSDNRENQIKSVAKKLFNSDDNIDPFVHVDEAKSVHTLAFKTCAFSFESNDLIAGFQTFLQTHESVLLNENSISNLILDKYLELCYAKKKHTYFRLLLQIYLLIRYGKFNIKRTRSEYLKIKKNVNTYLSDLNYLKSVPRLKNHRGFPLFVTKFYPLLKQDIDYDDIYRVVNQTYKTVTSFP